MTLGETTFTRTGDRVTLAVGVHVCLGVPRAQSLGAEYLVSCTPYSNDGIPVLSEIAAGQTVLGSNQNRDYLQWDEDKTSVEFRDYSLYKTGQVILKAAQLAQKHLTNYFTNWDLRLEQRTIDEMKKQPNSDEDYTTWSDFRIKCSMGDKSRWTSIFISSSFHLTLLPLKFAQSDALQCMNGLISGKHHSAKPGGSAYIKNSYYCYRNKDSQSSQILQYDYEPTKYESG
ncbi:hypothetical protein BBP40_002223 [Aspergillus hancockii]|nr:hypothetical protein BBP40_002223 [Aspergillus hancockii]